MYVENKMTNSGPMWVPRGLEFQCRTHIGPIWAPGSAHILPCLLGYLLTYHTTAHVHSARTNVYINSIP